MEKQIIVCVPHFVMNSESYLRVLAIYYDLEIRKES